MKLIPKVKRRMERGFEGHKWAIKGVAYKWGNRMLATEEVR